MSKISLMMDIGKRSMMNNQTALQTSGHNIANKSTEGFSRQRVELQTAQPIGQGKNRYGTGSKTAAITRTNNPYLERQLGNERSLGGFYDGKAEAMGRVEQVYNEQQNKGLNQFVSDFFSSVQEMANSPESLATRTQVRETADFLTKDFKRVHTQLNEITKDLDQQIVSSLDEVNGMTKEIASLNDKIQAVEMSGGHANDERDRRELLLKQVGDRINIRWAEGADTSVTVSSGSALLVVGNDSKTLAAKPTSETATKREGGVDIFYFNSERAEPINVTQQITGGKVGGILDVRDRVVTELLADVDKMAYGFAANMNEIHQKGFNAYNQTGGKFFELPADVRHASANLKVNQDIIDDVGRIATGASPGSPGDSRIALQMARLQSTKAMGGGEHTFDEFYNSVVGKVGIQARRAETASTTQRDIVKQMNNLRESVSGVSLDEEATKLIEYQKSFDASARLIRVADEMFDTVLNLKRL